MDFEKRMRIYQRFEAELKQTKARYASTKDPAVLICGIRTLAEKEDYHVFAHFVLYTGSAYIREGDYTAGITCIKTAGEVFPDVFDKTLYYVRMAEYHIENGDMDAGIDCLTRLCKGEGSSLHFHIRVSELTPVWDKYKHLVADLIPEEPAPIFNAVQSPSEPTMSISDILALPDADLLSDLSIHLNEMCGSGDYLNSLNKWERTVWYADELCMEVNSGGFEGYLYYHGTHFEKAYKAIADMGAPNVTALLDAVRAKFPRSRIPKSEDAIQNAMDKLEDQEVDFEDQDDSYYSGIERELLSAMTAFVRANAKRFR